jgi:hypothetical protein
VSAPSTAAGAAIRNGTVSKFVGKTVYAAENRVNSRTTRASILFDSTEFEREPHGTLAELATLLGESPARTPGDRFGVLKEKT